MILLLIKIRVILLLVNAKRARVVMANAQKILIIPVANVLWVNTKNPPIMPNVQRVQQAGILLRRVKPLVLLVRRAKYQIRAKMVVTIVQEVHFNRRMGVQKDAKLVLPENHPMLVPLYVQRLYVELIRKWCQTFADIVHQAKQM